MYPQKSKILRFKRKPKVSRGGPGGGLPPLAKIVVSYTEKYHFLPANDPSSKIPRFPKFPYISCYTKKLMAPTTPIPPHTSPCLSEKSACFRVCSLLTSNNSVRCTEVAQGWGGGNQGPGSMGTGLGAQAPCPIAQSPGSRVQHQGPVPNACGWWQRYHINQLP